MIIPPPRFADPCRNRADRFGRGPPSSDSLMKKQAPRSNLCSRSQFFKEMPYLHIYAIRRYLRSLTASKSCRNLQDPPLQQRQRPSSDDFLLSSFGDRSTVLEEIENIAVFEFGSLHPSIHPYAFPCRAIPISQLPGHKRLRLT